MRDINNVVCG